ncbi:MAG TPA: Ku protein [Solirubrobacteraceae bacterium]
MPRSIWNGTITFALIAVPVKVHSAIEDETVHFHQVHAKDGAPIKHKRICSKEGKEVPYKEVAKGYEVRGSEYVLLSQDEINAAAGEQAHRIELDEFVCQTDVDPVFYDRTYYLGTREDGEDAYRLLHDALARTDRAGIGRWVFHNREYLVAIRSLDGVIALHTMRFADELVPAKDMDVPRPSRKPTDRELKMATALVDSLHDDFDPSAFRDTYRKRVLDLIASKAKGEEIDLPEPEEPEQTGDLIAALEASIKNGSSRSKRAKRPSSGNSQRKSSSKTGRKSAGKAKR